MPGSNTWICPVCRHLNPAVTVVCEKTAEHD